jgi:hypothetical protein
MLDTYQEENLLAGGPNMDNPTILYEAAKQHHGEIKKEMAEWRMANQAKTTRPGLVKRFIMAGHTLLKKVVVRQKQEPRSPEEHLILNTNA